ncbi:hypothetical protein [Metabacillus fastidiosus]|uniref:hypothetical protein n=1 Tax=Metabacillus fastidiosus TaxID=1458 RepID=UPI003D2B3805
MAWEVVATIIGQRSAFVDINHEKYNYRAYSKVLDSRAAYGGLGAYVNGVYSNIIWQPFYQGEYFNIPYMVGSRTYEFTAYTRNEDTSASITEIQREEKAYAPTTPGAFTQPTGELEIGDSRAVSWGASTDPNGNLSLYVLEVSVNGGAWTLHGHFPSAAATYNVHTAGNVKFRVKATDSSGLESAWRESPLYTVTKPKYYYSKYNAVPNYVGTYTTEPNKTANTIRIGSTIKLTQELTVDPNTGQFAPKNTLYCTATNNDYLKYGGPGWYWLVSDKVAVEFTSGGEDSGGDFNCYNYRLNATRTLTGYTPGTLIQSGIVAEEGTYPNNGRHTDGYWYVRGSRVNASIAPPGPFTSPVPGSILLPGQQLTVSGANSTAANIAAHNIGVSYDKGATWTELGTPLTNSIAYTVTTDKTKKTVRFRSRARNTSNVYSDYVYSEDFTIQHNLKPTITLLTENNKTLYSNDTYTINGEARDMDNGNSVTVKYQINDELARNIASFISDTIAKAYSKNLIFKDKQLYDGATAVTGILAEGVQHTLKVWAVDADDSSTVETRTFTVVHNRAPEIITTAEAELGLLESPPSIMYQVNDLDNDTLTVTEKLDGIVLRTFTATVLTDYVITLTPAQWLEVTNGTHELSITVDDGKGASAVRPFNFERNETRIELQLKAPFLTDIAASRILISPDWTIPAGATVKVEVCNNAFDDLPTWEDCTNFVKQNRGFSFTNTVKTATNWGVDVRIIADKGTATDPVILSGFGGAFD